ncbi:hypothetical protein GK047_17715 [Paenibacillus sp. SYP-B3998]|uniref:Uncharacterized protein n=1 Tax=Paenibacillus sp. SYP-B3998 TaxID=2678564 RepID=A0A6G4A0G2_9BACL|nr:hypothetical protein [Paenibacillus sp. SYP-B3998]NEW07840.1 hypothetical protein [Paenibacillus sp. SYP-B3998]
MKYIYNLTLPQKIGQMILCGFEDAQAPLQSASRCLLGLLNSQGRLLVSLGMNYSAGWRRGDDL